MTPHEALAEGRLADAIALQRSIVAAAPHDPAARRLLVDLLAFSGSHDEALDHLAEIRPDEPSWPAAAQRLRSLFRAERQRSVDRLEPRICPDPPPRHAVLRWRAIENLHRAAPEAAVQNSDDAEAAAPHLRGFLDGQEFEGLHDADERYASVLEAFAAGEYVWFAWEGLRKVTLARPAVLLDQLYRPAEIVLKDGTAFDVHLPLVYPQSFRHDPVFALGTETDRICPDDGPLRCIGGKLLLVGDGEEVPLGECRMIEIR